MNDDITPASELERAYLEPEPFQLQDEVTSLTRDLSASAGLFQRSLDMIGRLQEQLAAKPADDLAQACIAHGDEAVRKDAERYRFLKDHGHFRTVSIDMGGNHTWTGLWRGIGKGSTVDEAIDAAMRAQSGGES